MITIPLAVRRPAPVLPAFMTLYLLALTACAVPPERAPCAELDCSGHGRCALVSRSGAEVPTCVCDSGYLPSPSGWLCLPPGDTSLCADFDCSGHGRCVSLQGAPHCLCDSGYLVDGSGLLCQSRCVEAHCGAGTCELDNGIPRCNCPAGERRTSDGLGCEPGAGPFAVYAFTTVDGWELGHATLDFSGASEQRLLETMSFSFGFDYGGRGLYRTTRLELKLDVGGTQPTSAIIDDDLSEGTARRRRHQTLTYAPAASTGGTLTSDVERAGVSFTVEQSYQGPNAPLPMLGAFEYPGWTFGCFSPAFYMLLLRHYDLTLGGEQQIEVYWPSTHTVAQLRVRRDDTQSTEAKPVLELVDERVRVAYDHDLPEKIFFINNDWQWTRVEKGTAADVNLSDPPLPSPFTAPPLPQVDETARQVSTSDGSLLAATLTRPPATSGALPAVLLVPGPFAVDGSHPDQSLPRSPLLAHLAAHLAAAGYVSLRYDPRGRGQSPGQAEQATLTSAVDDAQRALAVLAADAGVDATRVYVLSTGWSSMVALPLLAGTTPVAGYLGLAPVISDVSSALTYTRTAHLAATGFSTKLVDQQKSQVKASLDSIVDGTYDGGPLYGGVSIALVKEALAFDGGARLGLFAGPALLLRGDQDLEIDAAQLTLAQTAAQAQNKTNLETAELPGLTYHFTVGQMSDLWERAQLPLVVDTTLLTKLTSWLALH